MNIDCEKAKSLLGWFYDGELSETDRGLVARHIENCQSCAAEWTALAELDCASRRLLAPEPPLDQWSRIAQRLAVHDTGKLGRHESLLRRRFLWAAGLAAAVVIGAVLLGGLRRRNIAEPPQARPPGQVNAILVNLAGLAMEDRRLVEAQEICASDQCNDHLGAEGKPVKIVLRDKPVFLCSHGCEQWALAHPTETLAKLHQLEERHGHAIAP